MSRGSTGAWLLPLLLGGLVTPVPTEGQVVAEPVLTGQALLADSALTDGTVVLHQMTDVVQGEIDSARVAPDGSFVFRLPSVPNDTNIYFASLRHDGVVYFGPPIARPVELDSAYVISAYDTLVAPPEGVPLPLAARTLFFEPDGSGRFAITDIFEIRNDRERTLIPTADGRVWSYPLPSGAQEVSTLGGRPDEAITQEGDEIVFRAALQPGVQQFVLRYFVDSLSVAVPTPGDIEVLDVLVREPAPAIAIEGLVQEQSFQLEAGTTFRRFAGQEVSLPQVQIMPAEETPPPPVEWIAVVLALVLLGGGLLALRGGPRAAEAPAAGAQGRQALLVELARLDEEYESEASSSEARTREYRRRRSELLARLRALG